MAFNWTLNSNQSNIDPYNTVFHLLIKKESICKFQLKHDALLHFFH